ncbi:aminotransferase class I/II-fold pyridoxal phosphate-dependent enzyme [Streptomyces sp. NPDC002659]|uniref:aminotransferase class I/II-fold pyridoxal phosphate-dependent enzyme n=1 Tax=Streptomyces sp. NPDC002659 TaxID=3364656 RepID=UPI0036937BFD
MIEVSPYAAKWTEAPPGSVALTIADMDWPTDPLIVEALRVRIEAPLAYPAAYTTDGLGDLLSDFYRSRYGARVSAASFWLLSSAVSAAYLILDEYLSPGDEVLYLTPSYRFIPSAIEHAGGRAVGVELSTARNPSITAVVLEAAVTAHTRAIYLCNPHNPTGHVLARGELEDIAEVASRHDLRIISNEIHSRIMLDSSCHIPIATLSDDIARRTITLDGATKSHNLAGLGGVVLWSPYLPVVDGLRERISHKAAAVRALQSAAISAAFSGDSPWLTQTLTTLQRNREEIRSRLAPYGDRITYQPGAGTYFAWVDFGSIFGTTPAHTALAQHGLLVEPGADFAARDQQVRISFATSPEILEVALKRLKDAVDLRLARS